MQTYLLGDISFIAQNASKQIPNPNVLIELGYAFGCLGSSKIINIMNTAYGCADRLPFDLIHKRWPIRYNYSATNSGQRARKKKVLINSLHQALLLVLSEKLTSSTEEIPSLTTAPTIQNIDLHILNSSPDDWHVSTIKSKLCAVYQNDVNLRLEIDMKNCHLKEFKDEWLENLPKPHACSYWCNIIYSHSTVKRLVIVNTNDGTLIPAPEETKKATFKLSNFKFKIGYIFDQKNSLLKDLRTAKINIDLPLFKNTGIIIG